MASRDQLYGWAWKKARKQFLTENPLCRMCEDEGKVTPAEEVDHIEKHDLDPVKFWDVDNWQGLCSRHHRSTKAQMERSGKVKGCTADGTPLDPNHHWR